MWYKKLSLSLLGLCCLCSVWAQKETHYVIHSSRNLLGYDSKENRAVLKSASDAAATPLRFVKQTDGSYFIAVDGTASGTLYLSVGSSNGWSTYFLADSTSAKAHYMVEKTNGAYVKLKNMGTNGYLGVDDSKAGANVYSDKSGSDVKHQWILADTPDYEIPVDTLSYPIVTDALRQEIEGWGVSLCWWAGQCGKWSESKINQLIDWMVSPTGLNWNIFRYNIGGGDDPNWANCTTHHMGSGKGLRAEMEGFQDERGGEYHWERDAAQRKIMLKIKEKRPDAIFEAFSNSCPWWMTVSGCVAGHSDGGKDNLRKDYYEDFADYLVTVCKHYKDEYGIEFRSLEPFNEAMTNYWHQSGSQEGCHFDAESEIAFLKVLIPKLKASGLNTIISASDETNVGGALYSMRSMVNDGVAKDVLQFNTHTYGANNRERSQFGSLTRAAGKRCWMSETGSGGSGIAGNLSMAKRLFDDVRYICPDAWIDWQYMEEANDQWCFVRGSFANATVNKVKNYYVRQQVTRFIPAGYTFVSSLNEQSLAAINPTCDTLVVALLNTGDKCYHRISLPMTKVDGSIKAYRTSENESLKTLTTSSMLKLESDSVLLVPLPSASITTLLIPIHSFVKASDELVEGDTYLIIPQSNVMQAVTATSSSVKLADVNPNDPAQQWTPVYDVAKGAFRFRNGNGLHTTFGGSYDMTTSKTATSNNQLFDVEKVDGIFCRIMLHADSKHRGWDLKGANLSSGTNVGIYAYGNTADADTRHFQFVRIKGATSDEEDGIEEVRKPARTTVSVDESLYDLSGRKVTSSAAPKKGIYLKGGKKVTY